MISNPVTGANYFFQGLMILRQPGVKRFVILPLLINIFVFSFALWLAINQFDVFISWALDSLPSWLDWLEWILWPLFAVTFLVLIFFSFTLVANIISSPFNGPLAAAVERQLTGNTDFTTGRTFVQECQYAIKSELQKLKHALVLMMPLIFISLLTIAFPLIAPVSSILWLTYTAWVLTLEYADYPMANHGMVFRHIREKLAEKRILSLGFGAIVMFTTMIPFINFLVLPAAVAGATIMNLREFRD